MLERTAAIAPADPNIVSKRLASNKTPQPGVWVKGQKMSLVLNYIWGTLINRKHPQG
jgi:hypothetical protein